MISIELRMFEMSPAIFRARFAPVITAQQRALRRQQRAANARDQFAILKDSKETQAFLESVHKVKGIARTSAPRVLARGTSEVRVWTGESVSYVKDFDFELSKDGSGSFIADPVVDVVHDGMSFDASCATLPNGKIGLDFILVQSDLKRPIKQMKAKVLGAKEVTIELPEVHLAKLATSVEFGKGQTAMFALPPLGQKRVVAMIRVEAIDPKK